MIKTKEGNILIRKIVNLPEEEIELNGVTKKLKYDEYFVSTEKTQDFRIVNHFSIIGSYWFSPNKYK